MNWSDVLADPSLQDLPYKIELNQHGAIVMTPASNRHAILQGKIVKSLLQQTSAGNVPVECSVATSKGVRVPDVAWVSDQFLAANGDTTPFQQAPELCVEVVSPTNSRAEMEEKIQLYFAQDAREVWLCSEAGEVEFFAPTGPLETSKLFPEFPSTLK